MLFSDRTDAGRRLARRLEPLRAEDVVVLGLPRGGVPVAFEVANALDAPLDVIVVRKVGVPYQPELAMGAVGEGGVLVLNDAVVRRVDLGAEELAEAEQVERTELSRRVKRFRGGHERIGLAGRTALVVDDGVATGATARAACQVARAQGARRVVLAVPVGSTDAVRSLRGDADEVVCLAEPARFMSVGQWYRDFRQTSDEEVSELLDRARRRGTAQVAVRPQEADPPGADADPPPADADPPPAEAGLPPADPPPSAADPPTAPAEPGPAAPDDPPLVDDEVHVLADQARLAGHLTIPETPVGIVVFAHGSGSSRHSPRNRYVAARLHEAGLGTLLFDLLTPHEELDRARVFDVELLARRLVEVTLSLRTQAEAAALPIGYFGASTGAGAALWAAADPRVDVGAVVSRGGRPDLAEERLALVTTPTLLIVGGHDRMVLDLNRRAQAAMPGGCELAVVPGATHLFEEPGALDQVAELARDWFLRHLGSHEGGGPAAGPAGSGTRLS
ncbi:phosphoribosyltransferase family protein [Myceligenerans indicum]|uniref:Phosphoribosyltransferase n=1 Tax=Myceligenerans indicum TaxID=2593663 RepID=A0ABS1LLD1_9MICO|nr:phosphoribosyltransferase family protein [Myceligenerans indicum]MBL0886939.1 phosphoribosyltransferase [Myceligenerans indicum]